MPKDIRLHFINNKSEGDSEAQVQAMSKYFTLTDESPDFIYCASISHMYEAMNAMERTGKPLAVYCWDYYLWSHKKKNHSGDWNVYAEFLKRAKVIFVPSSSQQLRLKELLGLNSYVVHTGITTYDHEVKDGGYILDPVRYYPEENRTWAEEVAKELGIPFVHSEHRYSLEEFRKLVSNCTFMTCAFREASTGGLTLMEGLYNGKPSLVSDSPYMGAVDYLKGFGVYFKYDDKEDLKNKMKLMWESRMFYGDDAREHVMTYSYENMALSIYKKLCEL